MKPEEVRTEVTHNIDALLGILTQVSIRVEDAPRILNAKHWLESMKKNIETERTVKVATPKLIKKKKTQRKKARARS